jgi:type IV pilus assembly protein PilB
VKVAVSDPSDIATIDAIESYLGRKVEVYAASKMAINEALRKTETALQVLRDATEGFVMKVVEKEGGEEEEVISVETLTEQDGSIIKLVNSLVSTFMSNQKKKVLSSSTASTEF